MDDPKTRPGTGTGPGPGTGGRSGPTLRRRLYGFREARRPLLIGVLPAVLLACALPLRTAAESGLFQRLRDDLDLIEAAVTRWPRLSTVGAVLLAWALLAWKFEIVSTKVKVLGVEIQIRQTEGRVKAQVRNYLSTKRSVFVSYEEYDNYYDVIEAMYEILDFLRGQLSLFRRPPRIPDAPRRETGGGDTDPVRAGDGDEDEGRSRTEEDTYRQIEGMAAQIGKFLTRYQSDYRRYYELARKKDEGIFVPFRTIQDAYEKHGAMARDLRALNIAMRKYAGHFGIDWTKWQGWDEDPDAHGMSGTGEP